MRRAPWNLLPLLLATLVLSPPLPASPPSPDELDRAVARMQQWLIDQQRDDGVWLSPRGQRRSHIHPHAETPVVALALLESRQSFQSPPLRLALDRLSQRDLRETTEPHARALRAQLWARLRQHHPADLGRDARWLIGTHANRLLQRQRRWPQMWTDHAGLLALREYAFRGSEVPRRFWEDAAELYTSTQGEDGTWAGSSRRRHSRYAMTPAALNVLASAEQELHRLGETPSPQLRHAIDAASHWLDQHASVDRLPEPARADHVPPHLYYYYLHSLERLAATTGLRLIDGQDWFPLAARTLLERQRDDGSIDGNLLDTAYALRILARGRAPLWITKLELPDHDWNRYPGDLYFLTRALSQRYQRPLNWQRLSLDDEPRLWLAAPVAYLSGETPLQLDQPQRDNLKSYLDRGGLLLVNSENSDDAFSESIHQLGQSLYPDLSFQPLGENHPLASLLYRLDESTRQQIHVLNNGARDLIVLFQADWGQRYQNESPSQEAHWNAIANLFAAATTRGQYLAGPLASPSPDQPQTEPETLIRVGRIRLPDQPLVEPDAWRTFQARLFERTGGRIGLSVEIIDLDELTEAEIDLAHLGAVDPADLSEAQLDTLHRFAAKGGTILAETIAGHGAFSSELARSLRERGHPPTPLRRSHPILTGEHHEHADDLSQVHYRPYTLSRFGVDNTPRLLAARIDGREAILLSHEDLSLALLPSPHWRINGYTPASARRLLTNILLHVGISDF